MFSGNLDALGTALTESSNEAVEFVIGLAGIMAMWSGLMEIAERTGVINSLSRLLLPFTRLLFPGRRDPETLSSIIMSFMANIFGAGNSSTVFALRTMEKLDIENHKSPTASNDMWHVCRSQHGLRPGSPSWPSSSSDAGSSDPYSIVLPSMITAAVTILVSIARDNFLKKEVDMADVFSFLSTGFIPLMAAIIVGHGILCKQPII